MGVCTTCGAAQEPGAKFCTNCGTKANGSGSSGTGEAVQTALEPKPALIAQPTPVKSEETPSTPPVGEAHQSYPESPFYPDTPDQPARLGRGIAIVAAIVIVGCAVAYFFLAPRKPHGPAPIIDGRQTSSAPAVQAFGLDKYPGARPVTASSSDAEQVLAAFETNDSPQQVIGYYRVRFPVAQVTADPTHSTLSAEMNGQQMLVTADALIRGSRVRISVVKAGSAQ